MKFPTKNAAFGLANAFEQYHFQQNDELVDTNQKTPQEIRPSALARALPDAADAADKSCDDGVRHHFAQGTLTLVKGWHGGGATAFAGDQHITVRYTNAKGNQRTCHVFNTQKVLGGCYFTTCT